MFFEAGTWQFSEEELLIQLFPEPFWVLAGAAWAGLTGIGALGLLGYWLVARLGAASDSSAAGA